MRKLCFLVGMMFLLLSWFLVGCGISQEVYDAVVAERDSLAANLQSVQGELDAANSKVQSVQSELESASNELETAKSEVESTQSELTIKESELQSVQSELDAAESELKDVNDEMAEIKKLYPPRHFDSYSELRDWLLLNDVSERQPIEDAETWYEKALDIQETALENGYIVSAWIEYYEEPDTFTVACTAVVDGDIWWWDPEYDDALNFSDLTRLMAVR